MLVFYETNRICQLVSFPYCLRKEFDVSWSESIILQCLYLLIFTIYFLLCLKFITYLVCSSETESNRNRTSLKHSTGQSWFFTIVKPWKISSPGDQVIKVLNLHSRWNWITFVNYKTPLQSWLPVGNILCWACSSPWSEYGVKEATGISGQATERVHVHHTHVPKSLACCQVGVGLWAQRLVTYTTKSQIKTSKKNPNAPIDGGIVVIMQNNLF